MATNADSELRKKIKEVGNMLTMKNIDDIAGLHGIGYPFYKDDGFQLLLHLMQVHKLGQDFKKGLSDLLLRIGRNDLADVWEKAPQIITSGVEGEKPRRYGRRVNASILRAIEDTIVGKFLPPSSPSEGTKYYALVGEGGIGKTQLSLRYCELMSHVYDVIWFMSGDGLERFTEDLEDLMDEFEIEYKGVPPKKLKRTLAKKLNGRGKWLLVVDNFEQMALKDLEDRIPERGGTVVLTSRDHRVLSAKNIVEVKPFSDEEAMRLFENILGEGKVDKSLVQEVGELLGHNAFALSVCAYYLYESSIQADELAKEEIVKRMHELVTEMKHSVSGETVQAMYERSLLKLETESKAAWKLLCKLSLVSPDGVDKDIIGGFEGDHTTCMGKIQMLGLAERRGDKCYVHRLMMKVVQERMKKSSGEFTSVLEEVIGDIYRMWIWDSRDHTQWKKIQEMGEHVVSLAIHEEHLSSTKSREDLVLMLQSFSHYTIEVKADYTTAEERITKVEQVEGGGECSKVVRALLKSVRGDLNNRQGKYTEAITEYREALEMEEEESRKASYHNNIGICLKELKKYPEALEENEMSLEIDMKYKGENSIEVSNSLDNLGNCLSEMGSYEEALEKHRRALEIRLDKYGEVNPLIANSYNNFGNCYSNMEKYEDALEMHEKALELYRQVYGEECHPSAAASLQNVGLDKRDLGRVEEAKPHLEEAYRIRKQMLGEDHPDTINTKRILDMIFEEESVVKEREAEKIQLAIDQYHKDGGITDENLELFKEYLSESFEFEDVDEETRNLIEKILAEYHSVVIRNSFSRTKEAKAKILLIFPNRDLLLKTKSRFFGDDRAKSEFEWKEYFFFVMEEENVRHIFCSLEDRKSISKDLLSDLEIENIDTTFFFVEHSYETESCIIRASSRSNEQSDKNIFGEGEPWKDYWKRLGIVQESSNFDVDLSKGIVNDVKIVKEFISGFLTKGAVLFLTKQGNLENGKTQYHYLVRNSLCIQVPQHLCCIVGDTGAGKTTLLKRLIDNAIPQSIVRPTELFDVVKVNIDPLGDMQITNRREIVGRNALSMSLESEFSGGRDTPKRKEIEEQSVDGDDVKTVQVPNGTGDGVEEKGQERSIIPIERMTDRSSDPPSESKSSSNSEDRDTNPANQTNELKPSVVLGLNRSILFFDMGGEDLYQELYHLIVGKAKYIIIVVDSSDSDCYSRVDYWIDFVIKLREGVETNKQNTLIVFTRAKEGISLYKEIDLLKIGFDSEDGVEEIRERLLSSVDTPMDIKQEDLDDVINADYSTLFLSNLERARMEIYRKAEELGLCFLYRNHVVTDFDEFKKVFVIFSEYFKTIKHPSVRYDKCEPKEGEKEVKGFTSVRGLKRRNLFDEKFDPLIKFLEEYDLISEYVVKYKGGYDAKSDAGLQVELEAEYNSGYDKLVVFTMYMKSHAEEIVTKGELTEKWKTEKKKFFPYEKCRSTNMILNMLQKEYYVRIVDVWRFGLTFTLRGKCDGGEVGVKITIGFFSEEEYEVFPGKSQFRVLVGRSYRYRKDVTYQEPLQDKKKREKKLQEILEEINAFLNGLLQSLESGELTKNIYNASKVPSTWRPKVVKSLDSSIDKYELTELHTHLTGMGDERFWLMIMESYIPSNVKCPVNFEFSESVNVDFKNRFEKFFFQFEGNEEPEDPKELKRITRYSSRNDLIEAFSDEGFDIRYDNTQELVIIESNLEPRRDFKIFWEDCPLIAAMLGVEKKNSGYYARHEFPVLKQESESKDCMEFYTDDVVYDLETLKEVFISGEVGNREGIREIEKIFSNNICGIRFRDAFKSYYIFDHRKKDYGDVLGLPNEYILRAMGTRKKHSERSDIARAVEAHMKNSFGMLNRDGSSPHIADISAYRGHFDPEFYPKRFSMKDPIHHQKPEVLSILLNKTAHRFLLGGLSYVEYSMSERDLRNGYFDGYIENIVNLIPGAKSHYKGISLDHIHEGFKHKFLAAFPRPRVEYPSFESLCFSLIEKPWRTVEEKVNDIFRYEIAKNTFEKIDEIEKTYGIRINLMRDVDRRKVKSEFRTMLLNFGFIVDEELQIADELDGFVEDIILTVLHTLEIRDNLENYVCDKSLFNTYRSLVAKLGQNGSVLKELLKDILSAARAARERKPNLRFDFSAECMSIVFKTQEDVEDQNFKDFRNIYYSLDDIEKRRCLVSMLNNEDFYVKLLKDSYSDDSDSDRNLRSYLDALVELLFPKIKFDDLEKFVDKEHVVGFDNVGNEDGYPLSPFVHSKFHEICKERKKKFEGKLSFGFRLHCGENVRRGTTMIDGFDDIETRRNFAAHMSIIYAEVELLRKTIFEGEIPKIRLGHGIAFLHRDMYIQRDRFSAKKMNFKKMREFFWDNQIPVELNMTSNEMLMGDVFVDTSNESMEKQVLKKFLEEKKGPPVILGTDNDGIWYLNRCKEHNYHVSVAHEYCKGIMSRVIEMKDLKKIIKNGSEYKFYRAPRVDPL